MSIYGSFRTTVKPVVEEETVPSFSLGEMVDLQNSLLESLLLLSENSVYMESDIESLEEGANLEYREAFKAAKKEYKEESKKCKSYMKAKDWSSAKTCTKKMRAALDKAEKEIKSIDSTVGSAILGYFAAGLLDFTKIIIPYAGLIVGVSILGVGILRHIETNAAQYGSDMITKSILGAGISVSIASQIILYFQNISIIIKEIMQLILPNKNGTMF